MLQENTDPCNTSEVGVPPPHSADRKTEAPELRDSSKPTWFFRGLQTLHLEW